MFISETEAKRRLQRDENILRVPQKPELCPDVDDPDVDDGSLIGSVQERAPESPTDDPVLDKLLSDALDFKRSPGHIRGQKNQAHFAGKISDQKAIADVALIAGDSVARDLFGISVQQANAYEKGQRSSDTSMGLVGGGELLSHVTKTKEKLRTLAAAKLELALDHLTDDKLAGVKGATDLGRLAKDLATVHDKMERKETSEAGVQFHVFVPEVKQITNYNVIRISSEPKVKDSESI